MFLFLKLQVPLKTLVTAFNPHKSAAWRLASDANKMMCTFSSSEKRKEKFAKSLAVTVSGAQTTFFTKVFVAIVMNLLTMA